MLTVEGVSYTHPRADRPTLQDIHLSVGRGRILGLLGPNGAGKSTLMAILAGLIEPHQGRVRVNGRPLGDRGTRRTAVALAPQQDAFYPMLTVAENLACFASACGLSGPGAAERCEQAQVRTQLQAHRKRRAGDLSGGLKRRLNLAIALLGAPEVLLLDEPTAGVDPQSRAFLLQTLRTLADEGCTLVFSTHLMTEIEQLAEDVLLLDEGRVLRAQPLDALLAEGRRTLHLEFAEGTALAALSPLLARHGEVEPRPPRQVALHLHDGHAPAQVLAELDAAQIPVVGARWGRASLEETFMALTRGALRDE